MTMTSRRWGWWAAVEATLAALAVLADLFIPSLVLLAMALGSLTARRPGSAAWACGASAAGGPSGWCSA